MFIHYTRMKNMHIHHMDFWIIFIVFILMGKFTNRTFFITSSIPGEKLLCLKVVFRFYFKEIWCAKSESSNIHQSDAKPMMTKYESSTYNMKFASLQYSIPFCNFHEIIFVSVFDSIESVLAWTVTRLLPVQLDKRKI